MGQRRGEVGTLAAYSFFSSFFVLRDLVFSDTCAPARLYDTALFAVAVVSALEMATSDDQPGPLSRAVDLSMHPADPSGTFPELPLYRLLTAEDVLPFVAKAPSAIITGWTGFVFGVVWSLLLSRGRHRRWLSIALGGACLLLAQRVFRQRTVVVKPVSLVQDVSSTAKGPCRVTCSALSITNSHAGTHADMPFHFCRESETESQRWPSDLYIGAALLVNLKPFIDDQLRLTGSRAITKAVIEAFEKASSTTLVTNKRLIFCTSGSEDVARRLQPGCWSDFSYFELAAAEYLTASSSVRLVGVDAPSVDAPSLSPICDGSHGMFYSGGVAIVENLIVPDNLWSGRVLAIKGWLQTTFHPTQDFPDSRGCSVLFVPE